MKIRMVRRTLALTGLFVAMAGMTASRFAMAQGGPGDRVIVGHDQFHFQERSARGSGATKLARVDLYLDQPMELHIRSNTSVTALTPGSTNFTLGFSAKRLPTDLSNFEWAGSARYVTIPAPKVWVNCGSLFVKQLGAGHHSIYWFAGNVKGGPVVFDAGALSIQAFPLSRRSVGRSSKKIALLVGIDNYYSVTDLQGCENDIDDMKQILMQRFDFEDHGIVMLRSENATRENIISTFERHLIDQADSETVVVFHYSGHGSQTVDMNGDEQDGLDETLVPHDRGKIVGTTRVRDIPDDTIRSLLSRLAAKTQYITFVFDSCHSGTVTKAQSPVARWVDPQDPEAVEEIVASRARGTVSEFDHSARATSISDREETERYVVISGCKPNELSHEMRSPTGENRGALTYFFTNTIRQNTQEGVTYNNIMNVVHDRVSAKYRSQHPQIEGANQDGLIFDVPSIRTPDHFVVTKKEALIELSRGALDGLTVGTVLDAYAENTANFGDDQRIAKIELVATGPGTSIARHLQGNPLPATSWGIVRSHGANPNRVTVFVDTLGKSSALAKASEDELAKVANPLSDDEDYSDALELVDDASQADLLVFRRQSDDQFEISNGAETLHLAKASDDMTDNLLRKLMDWARWIRVVELENESPELKASVKVVPKSEGDISDGIPVLTEGEKLGIEVSNDGNQPVYLAIIVASSDGEIALLYGGDGSDDDDPLAPGETRFIGEVEVTIESKSLDVLQDFVKLIATTRPADLRGVAQSRLRSVSNPLASLMIPSRKSRSPVPHYDWTTDTATYKVVRKEEEL